MAEAITIRFIFTRLRKFSGLFRLRPFDVSTPDGRADERNRLVMFTTLASGVAKVISLATAFISVPLTLNYLGIERYGMWMTMSSVVVMLSFADFGIGNGMMNAVATAYGKDQHETIREHVSSGFAILTAIAASILALLAAFYWVVPWSDLFNVTSEAARQDAGPALAVLISCFAFAIPLTIVQRVQAGLQQGFWANLWQCSGSVLALIGVIVAIQMHASLPVLMLAYVGIPLVAAAVNTVFFFGRQAPQYAPRRKTVSRKSIRQITSLGVLFFVMQLVAAIVFSSDNIVIAQLLGAAAVTDYSVPQRLFSLIPAILGMVLMPLWPAYGEAVARGDRAWVWRTLRRSFLYSVALAALGSFVLVCAGNWVITLWVGHAIATSLLLMVALGILQVVVVGGSAVSMYMNGANVVRLQVVLGLITAVIAIALKVYLVPIIGISGVVWATILSYVLCVGIPSYFFILNQWKGAGSPAT